MSGTVMFQQNADGTNNMGGGQVVYNIKVEQIDPEDHKVRDEKITNCSDFTYEVPVNVKDEPVEMSTDHKVREDKITNCSDFTYEVPVIVKNEPVEISTAVAENEQAENNEATEELVPSAVEFDVRLELKKEPGVSSSIGAIKKSTPAVQKELEDSSTSTNIRRIKLADSRAADLKGNSNIVITTDENYFSEAKSNIHIKTHSCEIPKSVITSHTEIQSFTCEICHKPFKAQWLLNRHILTHTGEKPYECNVCKKRFLQKIHLTKHIRTHTGEKPFDCSICHRQFPNKSNLTRHISIHKGEKPYKCDVCSICFSEKRSLNYHLQYVHNNTGL